MSPPLVGATSTEACRRRRLRRSVTPWRFAESTLPIGRTEPPGVVKPNGTHRQYRQTARLFSQRLSRAASSFSLRCQADGVISPAFLKTRLQTAATQLRQMRRRPARRQRPPSTPSSKICWRSSHRVAVWTWAPASPARHEVVRDGVQDGEIRNRRGYTRPSFEAGPGAAASEIARAITSRQMRSNGSGTAHR